MKNFLIVVCVIVVVCLLGYAGQYMNEDVAPTNTVANNTKQNVSSSNKNNSYTSSKKEEVIDNKKDEEVVEEEKKEEQIVEENKENIEKDEDKKEEEPVVEENSISSEDKAIELAKKAYGSSSDVYFRIEQIQSNGVYIVSVRDNETTKDLAWYTVNVNNGTVK